jgi:hypothetical protein
MSYSIKNFLEDQYKDELSFLKESGVKVEIENGHIRWSLPNSDFAEKIDFNDDFGHVIERAEAELGQCENCRSLSFALDNFNHCELCGDIN